jgi:hypothetical protein
MPPNKSLKPTMLSRAFLRFELPLVRSGSRLVSLRKPHGGLAPAVMPATNTTCYEEN